MHLSIKSINKKASDRNRILLPVIHIELENTSDGNVKENKHNDHYIKNSWFNTSNLANIITKTAGFVRQIWQILYKKKLVQYVKSSKYYNKTGG